MAPVDQPQNPWRLAGAVAAVALVLGAATLIKPGFFQTGDMHRLHTPMKAFLVQALREGRLPLWNPHVGLGRPFLADPEAAVFYPMTALFLLLGTRPAFFLGLVLHIGIGAFGAARLARRLGATAGPSAWAMLFVAGTCVYVQFHGGAFNYACSLAYLPLVLVQAVELHDRPSARAIAFLAVVFALQLLSHPQPAWLSGFAAGTLMIGRFQPPLAQGGRRLGMALGALALAAAWGTAIAAVQLLPVLELIHESNRAQGSVELASSFAAPVGTWLSLLRPPHVGDPIGQLYAGSVVAVAGALGFFRLEDRNTRGLALMAVAAGLVSVGNATPLFSWLVRAIPFMAMLRVPSRAGAIVVLAMVLSATLFISNARSHRRDLWRWLLVAGIGCSALVASPLSGNPIGGPGWGWHLAAFLGAALLLGVRQLQPGTKMSRVAGGMLVALTCTQVFFSIAGLKQMAPPIPTVSLEDELQRTLSERGRLMAGAPPPRVSFPFPLVTENAGMRRGWSTYAGYGPAFLSRVWKTVHRLRGLIPPTEGNAFIADNVYDGGAFPFDGMSLEMGFDRASRRVGIQPQPDPRAYLAFASTSVADSDEALERMARGHDFHRNVLVEAPLNPPLDGTRPTGSVRFLHFEPDTMTLEVEAPGRGLLVLSETYYPGWHATVNGRPAEVITVNAWMRGVPVDPGHSGVVLDFRCNALLPGSLLSASALLAILLAHRRAQPNQPKTEGAPRV